MRGRNQHSPITAADKLACVTRELKYRYRVYDRLVAEGKMTAVKAAREIEIMEELASDLRADVEAERLPLMMP